MLDAFIPAELVAFPTFPHQNNVFSHDGWPGLDAFSCSAANVTGATDPTCTFAVLNVSNSRGKKKVYPQLARRKIVMRRGDGRKIWVSP